MSEFYVQRDMQKTTILAIVGTLVAIGIGILIGHYAIPKDERGFVDNQPLDFRRTTFSVYIGAGINSLRFFEDISISRRILIEHIETEST